MSFSRARASSQSVGNFYDRRDGESNSGPRGSESSALTNSPPPSAPSPSASWPRDAPEPRANATLFPCRFSLRQNRSSSGEAALDGAPAAGAPNVVLMSSMARSGSSFLGGLLSSLPGVFYFFEPLHNIERWHMLSAATARDGLRGLLTCNITGAIRKAVRTRGKYTVYHPYTRRCATKEACFGSLLDETCRREKFRAVKTIRARVSWLTSLLDDPEVNLRVIHLVRDPRGSVISNWKADWAPISEATSCQNLLSDLRDGARLRRQRPGKFLTVRYEDLCLDPRLMAEVILSFLGYTKLPQSTVNYLDKQTKVTRDSKTYSLRRDTKSQQQKWRTTITDEEFTRIEPACAAAILQLGFSLFGSAEAARNLSLPLYNRSADHQAYDHRDCLRE